MVTIAVTPHGVPALDVYKYFSTSCHEKVQRQQVAKLLGPRNFYALNNSYYLQSVSQLHQFIDLLKPRTREGETAAQLRERFLADNARVLQELSEFRQPGE